MNIISAPNANKVIISSENAEQTITTIELRSIVNEARKMAGESIVENSHFIKRVEDELEGELGGAKTFRPSGFTVDVKGYTLTLKQAMLVAIAVALCASCHRGDGLGLHGMRRMWAIKKMDELAALNVTIERLMHG